MPSNIYYHLSNVSNEFIFTILLEENMNKFIKGRIKDYLKIYKNTTIYISGHDLKKIGVKPSPIYAKILKLVLYLQLNGILKDRKDELFFIRKLKEKEII
jgi:hypothetical protein